VSINPIVQSINPPIVTYTRNNITRIIIKLNTDVNYDSKFKIIFFFHLLYSPLGPRSLIFQFYDHFTDGRTPWTSDTLVARPLPKHRKTQNKHTYQTSIPCVGFEPTIPASERAKRVHALDRSATMTCQIYLSKIGLTVKLRVTQLS
jgi:hypothetical protein